MLCIRPMSGMFVVLQLGMIGSIYGMNIHQLSEDLVDKKRPDRYFCQLAKNKNINEVHAKIMDPSPYNEMNQLDIWKMPEDKLFVFRFALLPQDVRGTIINNMFDKHEGACTKFTTDAYAHALLDFAYVYKGAQKNYLGCIDRGDWYSASPELRDIYCKLHNARKKSDEYAQLSLYDEYIIRTQMPPYIAQYMSAWDVNCQHPYRDRIIPACEYALSNGYAVSGCTGIAIALGYAGGQAGNMKTILDASPRVLREMIGTNQLCMLLIAGGTSYIRDKIWGIPIWADQHKHINRNNARIHLGLSAVLSISDNYTNKPVFKIITGEILPYQVAAGVFGTMYGFWASLREQSNQYPIEKRIDDIKDVSASN